MLMGGEWTKDRSSPTEYIPTAEGVERLFEIAEGVTRPGHIPRTHVHFA